LAAGKVINKREMSLFGTVSELKRRLSRHFGECAYEIRRRVEMEAVGDEADGHGRVAEQVFGLVDAARLDVGLGRLSQGALHETPSTSTSPLPPVVSITP